MLKISLIVLAYRYWRGFPGGTVVKNLPANAGNPGSIPGAGRAPGEGKGNPLQYSCLENSMDRGAQWATVHGVTKSQTWLSTYSGNGVIDGKWWGGVLYLLTNEVRKVSLRRPWPNSSTCQPGELNKLTHFWIGFLELWRPGKRAPSLRSSPYLALVHLPPCGSAKSCQIFWYFFPQ